MYAVFRSGGKQYRATKGDVLRLEKIEADEGATIKFDEVLLVGEGSDIKVGSPLLSGGAVSAKVMRQGKSRKVSVVKFKRRQNYLRQGSHRQFFTEVEITGITVGSAKKAAPKDATHKAAPKDATHKAAPKDATHKAAADKPAAKKAAAKKVSDKPAKKKAAKKASPKKAAAKRVSKKPAKKKAAKKAATKKKGS